MDASECTTNTLKRMSIRPRAHWLGSSVGSNIRPMLIAPTRPCPWPGPISQVCMGPWPMGLHCLSRGTLARSPWRLSSRPMVSSLSSSFPPSPHESNSRSLPASCLFRKQKSHYQAASSHRGIHTLHATTFACRFCFFSDRKIRNKKEKKGPLLSPWSD